MPEIGHTIILTGGTTGEKSKVKHHAKTSSNQYTTEKLSYGRSRRWRVNRENWRIVRNKRQVSIGSEYPKTGVHLSYSPPCGTPQPAPSMQPWLSENKCSYQAGFSEGPIHAATDSLYMVRLLNSHCPSTLTISSS